MGEATRIETDLPKGIWKRAMYVMCVHVPPSIAGRLSGGSFKVEPAPLPAGGGESLREALDQ